MLLCLPLTILGCAGAVDPAKWEAPLVLDMTGSACPALDSKTRREFGRTTPRPEPDTVDGNGKPAVSKRATQGWIDALEVSERRKNAAGRAVITEHDRCRGVSPAPSPIT